MAEVTPLMKQYLDTKRRHPDAILFFRVGDFYEMFYEDAVTASKILQIALTSRDKSKENSVPLCGIPYHAASGYIAKLIKAGLAVAVCEQVEDPALAKGLVKREVVRIITPGTLIEPELLSPKENNYVAAVAWDFASPLEKAKSLGLAYLDLSTGDFRIASADGWSEIESELSKIDPREVILPASLEGKEAPLFFRRWPIRYTAPALFIPERTEALLKSHFQIHSVAALGGDRPALLAAGALLGHVQETQKTALGNILSLRPHASGEQMRLHPLAQRHLELVPTSREGAPGTLLHLLDRTVTAMGGRLLREWILRPLLSPAKIIERQEAVASFYDDLLLRTRLRNLLEKISDLERLIGRISLKAAHPRDLVALKESIALLPEIHKALSSATAPLLEETLRSWDNLDEAYRLIESAIVPEPPLSIKEGGVIREGYLPQLDELRRFQKEGRAMLTQVELQERRRTGIESLKVRYNQVFGYYIEVSESQLKKIPPDYVRKQTLTRAERFTTDELRRIEEKLTGAEEAIRAMEESAFEEIRHDLSLMAGRVQSMAKKVALLDLTAALAEVAHQNNYVCPTVNEGRTIRIVEGRHPVLEQLRARERFVPNDTLLDPPSQRLLILTGPNMAGKSTYMRQVALIVLMAQMGSFVPAREATIGVVDQIFTRVGAQDALSEGMSTFMVEMTEMAQILRHATPRSLILLDEIGRGTSTFDGMSIAWAIAEHAHSDRLGARTLFATHYHELTQLAGANEGIRNYHVSVREWNDEIIFLRRMVEGGADKSYGIQVARLAGLPAEIIHRAKAVLKQLEENAWQPALSPPAQPDLFAAPPAPASPAAETSPIVERLRKIDPMNLTPLQALQILAELAEEARRDGKKG
ncbi:DNA mismatch repair protein MutS [Candidatus Manganitrophus noduliformans]|uniref:DNA mismatch repair protein MutS n=1 Tax=Candidatus Manganitrophus noduliformans TaxID=2606439 RepID=A0A7X6DU24_9BACT|nr:DNA mismatch repair protein MutS [Candidatus Manganitrophus noduliformans]NKE73305.1 DNA mismatch repair protein MutS [Candidatus Manganitrophus noduliformans]